MASGWRVDGIPGRDCFFDALPPDIEDDCYAAAFAHLLISMLINYEAAGASRMAISR